MRVRRWLWFWVALQLPFGALVAVGHAQAPAEPVGDDDLIYAQRHFERGREAFKNGDYEKALEGFSSSLQIYASPNTRLYLARTLAKLDRFTEAANTYEEVVRAARLKEADEPGYAAARTAAERELTELQNRLARITVSFTGPSAVVDELFINDQTVPRQAFGLATYVKPGTVIVRATFKDGRSQQQSVSLAARERKTVTLEVHEARAAPKGDGAVESSNFIASKEPEAAPEDGSSAAAVGLGVSAGVAAVGWGGALLFGILADNRFEKLSAECSGSCPASRNSEIDEGERYQTLANVGLVVGAVGTVAAGVALMFVLGDDSDVSSGEKSVTVGPGSVRVRW